MKTVTPEGAVVRSAVLSARTRHSPQEQALRAVGRFVLYVVIAAGAVVFAFPFVWMMKTSVTPGYQQLVIPPVWIPATLEWTNYTNPFANMPFQIFFQNTAIITVLGMLGAISSSSIVAFAFARMRFPGRDTIFVAMLATIMLPFPVTMIPIYFTFAKIGLINTFFPLIIPDWLGSPFLIFLLRQYYMTIPLEMDEAARMDGCSWFGIFWRILLPMSAPAIGVAAIYSFTFHWNNFIQAVIYLTRIETYTVPLGLALMNGRYAMDFGGMMAMATLSLIPVLIVFFTAQRYFIQGIVVSGVKG